MEKMKDLAYYNGKITSIDDMMIPANDRRFYFGDGIYEAAMVFDYKIYALQDHLDRMFNSAAMLRIELPYTKEEVGALLTRPGTEAGEQLPVPVLAGNQRNLSEKPSVPG